MYKITYNNLVVFLMLVYLFAFSWSSTDQAQVVVGGFADKGHYFHFLLIFFLHK